MSNQNLYYLADSLCVMTRGKIGKNLHINIFMHTFA